jgi:hypothetical protein
MGGRLGGVADRLGLDVGPLVLVAQESTDARHVRGAERASSDSSTSISASIANRCLSDSVLRATVAASRSSPASWSSLQPRSGESREARLRLAVTGERVEGVPPLAHVTERGALLRVRGEGGPEHRRVLRKCLRNVEGGPLVRFPRRRMVKEREPHPPKSVPPDGRCSSSVRPLQSRSHSSLDCAKVGARMTNPVSRVELGARCSLLSPV